MKCVAISAGLVVAVLTSAAPLEAQLCFRGRPAPECRQFLITEAGYLRGAKDGWLLMSELGFMHNLNDKNALGGTVLAGPDGTKIGFKLRYRRWLSPNLTLEASPGVILEHDRLSFKSPGFTGHVGVGYGDQVGLTLVVQAIPVEGEDTEVRSYFGFRLGSNLGIAAHIFTGMLLLAKEGIWW